VNVAYWVGTTDAIDGDEVWTSGTKLRERHDTVQGVAYSDVDGVLKVQQSIDGTFDNDGSGAPDWEESVTITGGTGAEFNFVLVAPFWRLVYTNGADDQTKFRIGAMTEAGGDS
jgi:hypothetical protein